MRNQSSGFTLIEISIVLVIIGLIVGGILVGREMITAAEIRATVSQIQKYTTAMNAFRIKYGGLPGDLTATQAARFGFITRAGGTGDGDGNGIIEGKSGLGSGGSVILGGETVLFWTDLSSAQLIGESFTDSSDAVINQLGNPAAFTPYLPRPKMPTANASIFAYNGYPTGGNNFLNNQLFFDIVELLHSQNTGTNYLEGGISPGQAFAIDSKLDDGLPLTGKVQQSEGGQGGIIGGLGIGPTFFGSTEGFCSTNAPSKYNIAHPDPFVCNLAIIVQ